MEEIMENMVGMEEVLTEEFNDMNSLSEAGLEEMRELMESDDTPSWVRKILMKFFEHALSGGAGFAAGWYARGKIDKKIYGVETSGKESKLASWLAAKKEETQKIRDAKKRNKEALEAEISAIKGLPEKDSAPEKSDAKTETGSANAEVVQQNVEPKKPNKAKGK